MTDAPPPHERHEATDRFGKAALRAAHRLTEALDDDEDGVPGPVVVRRNGPHRSLDGLAALLDEALQDDEDGTGPDDAAGDRPAR
ncbi:hypothetical protein ACI782_22500 [Geodermatophilus sp. SYSU D00703]